MGHSRKSNIDTAADKIFYFLFYIYIILTLHRSVSQRVYVIWTYKYMFFNKKSPINGTLLIVIQTVLYYFFFFSAVTRHGDSSFLDDA